MLSHGESAARVNVSRPDHIHRHVTSSLGKLMGNVRTQGKDVEIDEDELDELVGTSFLQACHCSNSS